MNPLMNATLLIFAIACVCVEARTLKGQGRLVANEGKKTANTATTKTYFQLTDKALIGGNEKHCLIKHNCIFPDVVYDVAPTVKALEKSNDFKYSKKFWATKPPSSGFSSVDEMKKYLTDYVLEAVYDFFNRKPVPTRLKNDDGLQLLGLEDIRLLRTQTDDSPTCPDPKNGDDNAIALYKCCVSKEADLCEKYADGGQCTKPLTCPKDGPKLDEAYSAVNLSSFVKSRRGDCRIHALVSAAILQSFPTSAGVSKVSYVYVELFSGFDHAFLTFEYKGKTYSFDARKGMKNLVETSVDESDGDHGTIKLLLADGKGKQPGDKPFDLSKFPKKPSL